MGDFNAKIGEASEEDSDIMGKFGFGTRNDRGHRLIDFVREKQLFFTNTMFKKRQSRRATWSLGRASNEIEFILITKPMKTLVINVEVLNRFDYKSDHRMVQMQLGLKFIRSKRKAYTKRIFIDNEKVKIGRFRENLEANRLTLDGNTSLNFIYDELLNNIVTCAEPFTKKKPKDSIITQETKTIMELRDQLILNRKRSLEDDAKFKEMRKKANQMKRKDVRNFEILQLEQAIASNTTWKRAKEGAVQNKIWIPKLRDKNDVPRSNRAEVLEIAASFYEDLYSTKMNIEERLAITPKLDGKEEIEDISLEEMRDALLMMKNGKATTDDNITSELLKLCDIETIEVVRDLFNKMLSTEEIPSSWLESRIILLHKKGDKSKIENYRPLTKVSQFYKWFAKIVLNRISEKLDDHQHKQVSEKDFPRAITFLLSSS